MTKRKTINEVRQYIESRGYYLMSTTYNNNKEKLLLKSPEGIEFRLSFNHFMRGVREPQTATKRRIDKVAYSENDVINLLSNKGMTLVGSYNGYNNPIQVSDGVTTWKTTINKVMHGYSNSIYNQSLHEGIIADILDYNNIPYEREYLIKYNSKTMYIDFYISIIGIAIEYDGIQHTQGRWHDEGYKERDANKNEYCINSGINLLRISSIAYSISDIIKELQKVIPELKRPSSLSSIPEVYKEVATYYGNHTSTETQNKFGISDSTVRRYANIFK